MHASFKAGVLHTYIAYTKRDTKIGRLYIKGTPVSGRGTKTSIGCVTVEANSG